MKKMLFAAASLTLGLLAIPHAASAQQAPRVVQCNYYYGHIDDPRPECGGMTTNLDANGHMYTAPVGTPPPPVYAYVQGSGYAYGYPYYDNQTNAGHTKRKAGHDYVYCRQGPGGSGPGGYVPFDPQKGAICPSYTPYYDQASPPPHGY